MLIRLSDPSWSNEHDKDAGKKAINLHKLFQASITTLDGYVTTAEGLEENVEAIWSALSDEKPLAVRSSMGDEDDEEYSNAGKYKSFIGINSYNNLLRAVREVLSSNFGSSSKAALVQPCFRAEVSGVAFSSLSTDDDTCLIEATYGLGEILVSGLCIPDRYICHTNQIRYRLSNSKAFGMHITNDVLGRGDPIEGFFDSHIVLKKGNKALVSYSPLHKGAACLSETQIWDLYSICKKIEHMYGVPQDIEYAFNKENGFVILQTRNITKNLNAEILFKHNENDTNRLLAGGKIYGTGASSGIAEGIAVSSNEIDDFDTQEVIVIMDQLDSELLYKFFGKISGIICKNGSILSHAAIMAREYHIPCVVELGGSISKIHSGDRLVIDGSKGVVSIN